jgi:hypothetical protein
MVNNPDGIPGRLDRVFGTWLRFIVSVVFLLAGVAVIVTMFREIGTSYWELWVLSLGVAVLFGIISWDIWSSAKAKENTVKEIAVILRKLRHEGYSENELKSVAIFASGYPGFGLTVLRDREQISKEEFLTFVEDWNTSFPRETWQYKLGVVGVFLLAPALTITAVLLWR